MRSPIRGARRRRTAPPPPCMIVLLQITAIMGLPLAGLLLALHFTVWAH